MTNEEIIKIVLKESEWKVTSPKQLVQRTIKLKDKQQIGEMKGWSQILPIKDCFALLKITSYLKKLDFDYVIARYSKKQKDFFYEGKTESIVPQKWRVLKYI